jgi:hypothetical protein
MKTDKIYNLGDIYRVTYMIPFLDGSEAEPHTFRAVLPVVNTDWVKETIDQFDADLAGVSIDECAGFEMIHLVKNGDSDEYAFIALTLGLGPRPESNTYVVGTLVKEHTL